MNTEKRVVLDMLGAGASGYLIKDCAFEELVHAVRTVVSSEGVYLSPKITGVILNGMVSLEAGKTSAESAGLTSTELEVLRLLAEGKSTKEIASRLSCSVKSVEYYRKQIMKKLCIETVAELIKFAIREGLVPL